MQFTHMCDEVLQTDTGIIDPSVMGREAVWASALLCSLARGAPCSVAVEQSLPASLALDREAVVTEEAPQYAAPQSAPGPAADAVVLVTLDGVRWQEVFEGADDARMPVGAAGLDAPHLWPNVYRLLRERGVALGGGAVSISASGPNFMSLPGYMEILTGHSPPPCENNECSRTTVPTIVDALVDQGRDAVVVASWERLDRAVASDLRSAKISAGRRTSSGLRGSALGRRAAAYRHVSPAPGGGDYRPDRFTAELGLLALREERPAFLMIGLGDPDEYAHANDYPGYLRSLGACDAFIGKLFQTLDQMGDRGSRTTVIVSADHGRGSDFQNHGGGYAESARVFLLAFGAGIETRGVVQLGEARRLSDIAPTIRGLLGVDPDRALGAGRPIEEIRVPRYAWLP